MKKQILVALLAMATLASVGCSKDDASNILVSPDYTAQGEVSKLPTEARQFVAQYFKGYSASEVKINAEETENGSLYTSILEKTDLELRATVVLPSRVKIEFDRNGQWREIECLIDGAALPANILAILPAPIVQYVQRNYPGIGIHEIERKSYGYKVELVNDKEILFDRNGELLSDNKKGQQPQQPNGNQLDNKVQSFVRTHFPSYKVAYTKNDRDNGVERRKVYIRKSYWQSFKLVFDMQGNWLEVEGDDYGRTPVPASVIGLLPQGVVDVLSRSYSSRPVTSIEKKVSGYKIELAGDVELYFDR
ncbi:MAG: PepSY-like domain-containing protein, partial [Porphyromonadaceae bacterium]|nr:PepSY-like domain-containing protein [Porphyromonadaceae bacterium]